MAADGRPRYAELEGAVMNMTVSLTDELASFVEAKISTGDVGSSSEVIREALRRVERAQAHDADDRLVLRQAWQAGIDSGDAGDMDVNALKQEARARFESLKA